MNKRIHLDIENASPIKVPEALREAFLNILSKLPEVHGPLPQGTIELLLCNDEQIQAFNRTYRGKDKPTDVLSFNLAQDFPKSPEGAEPKIGQLVISTETAQRQADELGQTLKEELRFLFTHGLLHLLGYDHEEAEEEKLMLEKVYALLGRTS